MIYMFLSNNPSSGDINSSYLPCSMNFLLFLMFTLIFMNIQNRLFIYLIILIKMQCLNFDLVPSIVVYNS